MCQQGSYLCAHHLADIHCSDADAAAGGMHKNSLITRQSDTFFQVDILKTYLSFTQPTQVDEGMDGGAVHAGHCCGIFEAEIVRQSDHEIRSSDKARTEAAMADRHDSISRAHVVHTSTNFLYHSGAFNAEARLVTFHNAHSYQDVLFCVNAVLS